MSVRLREKGVVKKEVDIAEQITDKMDDIKGVACDALGVDVEDSTMV